jgi:hypothetical protein
MASSTPNVYAAEYRAARSLFDTDTQGCIEAAKENLLLVKCTSYHAQVRALTDFGALSRHDLPPYYEAMNLVLITSALDDWDEAEMWRLSAQEVYRETLEDPTYTSDEASCGTLKKLREELDALIRFKDEDMLELYGVGRGSPEHFEETEDSPKRIWEDSDFFDDDDDDDDDDNRNNKDNSKIVGAQAFETKELELPIRPGLRNPTQATEVAQVAETTGTDAAPLTETVKPAVTTGSVRRHKCTTDSKVSNVSKEGA